MDVGVKQLSQVEADVEADVEAETDAETELLEELEQSEGDANVSCLARHVSISKA